MVVERMVVVGQLLGRMVGQGLGRSSCSDEGKLVVGVGLVAMGVQEVLVVLEVRLVLGFLGFPEVLVVHQVLALLVLRVVPLVLDHLVVLGLVVVVGVVVEVVVVVVVVEVGMAQLVLRG